MKVRLFGKEFDCVAVEKRKNRACFFRKEGGYEVVRGHAGFAIAEDVAAAMEAGDECFCTKQGRTPKPAPKPAPKKAAKKAEPDGEETKE